NLSDADVDLFCKDVLERLGQARTEEQRVSDGFGVAEPVAELFENLSNQLFVIRRCKYRVAHNDDAQCPCSDCQESASIHGNANVAGLGPLDHEISSGFNTIRSGVIGGERSLLRLFRTHDPAPQS